MSGRGLLWIFMAMRSRVGVVWIRNVLREIADGDAACHREKVKRMKSTHVARNFAAVIAVVFTFAGCGGGYGVQHRFGILKNDIHLQKESLGSGTLDSQFDNKIGFSPAYSDAPWAYKSKDFKADNMSFAGHRVFTFDGNNYKVADRSGWKDQIAIISDSDEVVKKISLSRYILDIIPLEVELREELFLVLFVRQQATSDSSTLLVLDKDLEIVYREQLPRGRWISLSPDSEGFVVSTWGPIHSVNESFAPDRTWIYQN